MLASPFPFQARQPDGTEIELYITGNPRGYYYLDKSRSYPVVQDASNEYYVYADISSDGDLVKTSFVVGGDFDPADLPLRSIGESRKVKAPVKKNNKFRLPKGREVVRSGTVQNLVVLVRWSNSPPVSSLPTPAQIARLFNSDTQSVKDVYRLASGGKLTVESTVTEWLTVSSSESQAAAGASGMACCNLFAALKDALAQADRALDFSKFDSNNDKRIDMIAFLHSGYGAEWGANAANRIWSHMWSFNSAFTSPRTGVQVSLYHISPALWGTSGTQLGRIGVIAHETGHFLGLPDLYDRDGNGAGLGAFSLMANSWGFDGSQNYPPAMDAWCRLRMNWVDAIDITTGGSYDAKPGEVYRIARNFPEGEYLLIEYRPAEGYDRLLPGGGGLAVYHIDDKAGYYTQGWPGQQGWPENGNHYRVALLQADGRYDLERSNTRGDSGDLYRSGSRSLLGPDTVPGTRSYQRGSNNRNTGITVRAGGGGGGGGGSFTVSFQDGGGGGGGSSSSSTTARTTSTSATTASTTATTASTTASTTSSRTTVATTSQATTTSSVTASTYTTTRSISTSPTGTPTGTGPKKMYIDYLRLGRRVYGARATVRVVDRDGEPVPGATVRGRFSWPQGNRRERERATDENGVARLYLKVPQDQRGQQVRVRFCVLAVTKEGWRYATGSSGVEVCTRLSRTQERVQKTFAAKSRAQTRF
jgi:M6 family metalloprotease-like protein